MLPADASATPSPVDALLRTSLGVTAAMALVLLVGLAWLLLGARTGPRSASARTVAAGSGALLGVLLVLDLILVTASRRTARNRMPTGPAVVRVELLAQQFSYNVRQAGDDGVFGTDDDVVELDRLRVPAGRPVVIEGRAKDVVHSAYFPHFRAQVETVPGRTSRAWFTPGAPGRYEFLCTQLCGPAHYQMRGEVEVMAPDAWAAHMARAADDARRAAAVAPLSPERRWAWPWGR
jgi:cytochrome c oxidase subunit 2